MQNFSCIALFFAAAVCRVRGENLKGTHHQTNLPILTSPLNCTCPDSYTLIGNRCERAVQFAQETTCPLGFSLANGSCLRQLTPEETCPYGYARIGNQCVQRIITLPTLGCTGNYTLEATTNWGRHDEALVCTTRIPVNTALECPDGTPYNGLCTSSTTVPASFTCPPGFIDAGNNSCNRNAEVDCRSRGHLRRLNSVPLKRNVDAGWTQEVAAAAQFGTPAGSRLATSQWHNWHGDHKHVDDSSSVLQMQESCFSNVTIAATPFCTEGTLRGNFCVVDTVVEPVTICPAYGTPADCFAFDRQGPQSICPAGFNQECGIRDTRGHTNIDCDCVQINTEAVTLVCPPGFVFADGLCADTAATITACPANSVLVNGLCQRVETTPAICTYNIEFACLGEGCTRSAPPAHHHALSGVSGLLTSVAQALESGRGAHHQDVVPFPINPAQIRVTHGL